MFSKTEKLLSIMHYLPTAVVESEYVPKYSAYYKKDILFIVIVLVCVHMFINITYSYAFGNVTHVSFLIST